MQGGQLISPVDGPYTPTRADRRQIELLLAERRGYGEDTEASQPLKMCHTCAKCAALHHDYNVEGMWEGRQSHHVGHRPDAAECPRSCLSSGLPSRVGHSSLQDTVTESAPVFGGLKRFYATKP